MISVEDMLVLVECHGVGAKLKRAICKREGWSRDDWYKHWQLTGDTLEVALRYRMKISS